MAITEDTVSQDTGKRSKLPLMLGFVLALVGAGGGFYAVQTGMLLGNGSSTAEQGIVPDAEPVRTMPDVAFVPVDPILISLNEAGGPAHLRFRAQLEVPSAHAPEVERLMPRVVDVLNSYLRVVKLDDVRDPSGLVRMRAQMLRRVQIVTGGGRVNDLLIMEFVLN